MRRSLALVLAVLPLAAHAQLVLEDDFEFTLLASDTPPGKWDSLNSVTGVTVATSPGAGRRDRGLRFDDQRVGNGAQLNPFLSKTMSGSGDQTVRFWWRSTPSLFDSYLTLVNINISSAIGSAVEAKWNPDAGAVFLVCHDASSNSISVTASAPLVQDGGFHLVEVRAFGVGTDAGICAMSFDGQPVAATPLDFSGRTFTRLSLTAGPRDDEFVGMMDFDSLVASPGRRPIRVELEDAGAIPSAPRCAPLDFSFRDSSGTVRPLDVTEKIIVALDGGALFLEPACVNAVPDQHQVIGGERFRVWARAPGPGNLLVSLTPRTLLGLTATLQVYDGGAEGSGGGAGGSGGAGGTGGSAGGAGGGALGPGNYLVGCSCDAASAGVGAWFALVVLLATRRLRRSSSPAARP